MISFLQEDMEKMEAQEKEQKQLEAQKKLFEGLKFFLNRETPRESLAFVIRWVKEGGRGRIRNLIWIIFGLSHLLLLYLEPGHWGSSWSRDTQTCISTDTTNILMGFLFCFYLQVFRRPGILGKVHLHRKHIWDDGWDYYTSNSWPTKNWQTIHQQVRARKAVVFKKIHLYFILVMINVFSYLTLCP